AYPPKNEYIAASNRNYMSKANKKTVRKEQPNNLFGKENYMWMIIGAVVLAIGFALMAGGKSADPNVFNPDEIYGFRRITLAPILVVAGFVIEIYAIMKKPKNQSAE